MRRFLTTLLGALLIAAGLSIAPGVAAAAPGGTPCTTGTPVPGDYDGDGRADRLVGATASDADQSVSSFRVAYQVVPADGGAPYWIERPERSSVVNADLNGDLCADVVIDVTTLLLGSPAGLDAAHPRTIDVPQVSPDPPLYRRVLRSEPLRHDGISQVVVAGWFVDTDDMCCEKGHFLDVYTLDAAGVPGTPDVIDLAARGASGDLVLAGSGRSLAVGDGELSVKGHGDAGGVFMFSSSAGDPTTLRFRTLLTQNSPGIPDVAEENDWFGAGLSFRDGRLAIGALGEQFGRIMDAGLVQPIRWHEATSTYTAYRAIHQGTRGVVGTNEAGDYFGSHVVVTRGLTATGSYDIAIGASEVVGKAYDAGSVTVANFTRPIYRTFTQNSRGVPGTAEPYDEFGGALGVVRTSATTDTLLIGASGEDSRIRGARTSGYVVRSDGRKLTSTTKLASIPRPANTASTTYGGWGLVFAT